MRMKNRGEYKGSEETENKKSGGDSVLDKSTMSSATQKVLRDKLRGYDYSL
jgi:hypothetical protein